MKPVKLNGLARAELDKAMAWYNEKQPGVGLELLDDVLSALDKVARDPGIGANYGTKGRRFYRLMRFPYLLYYTELPDHVWVAAIAHERRRPDYWKRRKPE